MSLTYQPFAQTPDVDRLGHELQMNVSDGERVASGLIGAGLTALGVARGGITRWALILVSGALLRRAFTGHCPVYERLEMDTRHMRVGTSSDK